MHNDITIRQASLDDLDLLIQWRMEVLHCVFSIPAETDTAELRQQNIDYYRKALANGSHIACFAVKDEGEGEKLSTLNSQLSTKIVGCGGLCLYDEMPSPDNPTGHCAYLMNIYVRPEHQGHGTGTRIVRWLVGAALSRGIKKIYLETSEAGRLLYSVLGFSDMKDMMHLSFSE